MKLIACMSVYNEAEYLERVLEGLYTHGIDKVIVVDGAYEGFPHKEWRSNDGTLRIIEQCKIRHPDWLILISAPETGWAGQEVKRTVYFRVADTIATAGDWLIQVDGDEELAGDLPDYRGYRFRDFLAELPATGSVTQVNTIYVGIRGMVAVKDAFNRDNVSYKEGNIDKWAKVYRWMPGLHYGREHWDILGGDGERIWDLGTNFHSQHAAIWEHFYFRHWSDCRSAERKNYKSDYENYRSEYRATHGGCMNPNEAIEVEYEIER